MAARRAPLPWGTRIFTHSRANGAESDGLLPVGTSLVLAVLVELFLRQRRKQSPSLCLKSAFHLLELPFHVCEIASRVSGIESHPLHFVLLGSIAACGRDLLDRLSIPIADLSDPLSSLGTDLRRYMRFRQRRSPSGSRGTRTLPRLTGMLACE